MSWEEHSRPFFEGLTTFAKAKCCPHRLNEGAAIRIATLQFLELIRHGIRLGRSHTWAQMAEFLKFLGLIDLPDRLSEKTPFRLRERGFSNFWETPDYGAGVKAASEL